MLHTFVIVLNTLCGFLLLVKTTWPLVWSVVQQTNATTYVIVSNTDILQA